MEFERLKMRQVYPCFSSSMSSFISQVRTIVRYFILLGLSYIFCEERMGQCHSLHNSLIISSL